MASAIVTVGREKKGGTVVRRSWTRRKTAPKVRMNGLRDRMVANADGAERPGAVHRSSSQPAADGIVCWVVSFRG